VRVHEVEIAGFVRGFDAQHTVRESAELSRKVVLVQPLVGAGHDVPDRHPRRELFDSWQVARRGAREDLDFDAAPRESLGDLAHVDVHAARVAAARLVER
jgi:hypothetical protein